LPLACAQVCLQKSPDWQPLPVRAELGGLGILFVCVVDEYWELNQKTKVEQQ